MAKLVLLQAGQATPYLLADSETVIGRLAECGIPINSNMVSRKHARVVQVGDDYQIEDLGSGNGTFLNGQKLDGAVTLKHNDRIKLGPILFRFESDKPQAAVSKAAASMGVQLVADDSGSTIMGASDKADGFGLLDVQPAAKLKAILEISRSLTGNYDPDKLLPKLLDTLFSIFPQADRGCILVQDRAGHMVPKAMKHRREGEDASVKLSRTILKAVIEQKKAILSADAASDAQFQASESISNLSIRSMMCAPLLGKDGDALGVINIDTQNAFSQFKKDDLEILIAVAGQAAMAYEGARLFQSYVEKQKQDSEMNIAADVQKALLPEHMPEIDGYEFYTAYEAAQAVGGDYYDVVELKSGKICLAFGDVAGKGVPASLVMSRISSVVRSTVVFVEDALEALIRINEHMCARAVEGRFVTFVLTILDPKTHHMQIVNAGHMSPMIRKADGTVEEFHDDVVGLPLGVMEDYPYEAVERTLAPGETVVIFTDGVSESMNKAGDLYGLDKLRQFVARQVPRAKEMGEAIRADVKRHANGHPQNDDITLMLWSREP